MTAIPFLSSSMESISDDWYKIHHQQNILKKKKKMEATTTLQMLVLCPRLSGPNKSRFRRNEHLQNIAKVDCDEVASVPRRFFLQFVVGLSPLVLERSARAAPLPDMKEPEIVRTVKLDSGVRFQDVIEGEGAEAHEGDIVEVNYVCRRSNGYFVYSTVDQFTGESRPVILPLDKNQIIEGLKEVLVGMRAGGKRRALIPPSVGYVNENLKPVPDEFGPRRSLMSHASESLVFEVQLLKVLRFQPLLTII